MAIDGVRSVHMLRTRRHGAEASADVHVQVPPRISVSEGHMISQAVEDRLIDKVESITDVTVHIDPEDDEDTPTCRGLPLRAAATKLLEGAWDAQNLMPTQYELRLHYLAGRIDVELIMPLASFVDSDATQALQDEMRQAVARSVVVWRPAAVVWLSGYFGAIIRLLAPSSVRTAVGRPSDGR